MSYSYIDIQYIKQTWTFVSSIGPKVILNVVFGVLLLEGIKTVVIMHTVSLIFTESAHWADTVIESRCPCVRLYVRPYYIYFLYIYRRAP